VNRGMEIRRSVPFFRQIRRSANSFAQNPRAQPHPATGVLKFKRKLVNVNATVNFERVVNKATCSMTSTQYNSNKSPTPEFK